MTTIDNVGVAQDFLDKQVELLEAGDTAGLSKRYTEDAVFVRFDGVAVGRDQIKQLFDEYLAEKPDLKRVDAVKISANVLLYQAEEVLGGKTVTAVGTLVFVNGLVWRQTATFVDRSTS
jgi:ketosteroid isomerase-like protein